MVIHELLSQYPFFSFLNKSQLKTIARLSKNKTFESGELIFREGEHADWLFVLIEGIVDLFFTVELPTTSKLSKELLFGQVNPIEIFGISALIEPHLLTSSARASQTSQVIMIEAAGLLALCNKDEKLAYAFIRQVGKAVMERIHATRSQLAIVNSTVPY